ncbi:MAG TPA: hypothetical protein VHW72_20025 [Candidatus Angelobacter sp.]|nr:hypothetical protein [Candidatus Angelobacter sp.]
MLGARGAAQTVPPVGELFASDNGSSGAMHLAGSGMSVYSGSELAAGIAPATLQLVRGGQVRICPHSGLNVTSSNHGLMLATGAGTLEIDYQLEQGAADIVITPDFNVALAGPGTFHFALGINRAGDTCMKPLPGNTSEVTFSELLGTGIYKAEPDQPLVFKAGKADARAELTSDCGCPPAAPVMRADAQPGQALPTAKDKPAASPVEHVAVAASEPTSPLPPDKPGQVHIQVDAPFVFSARPGSGRPYSVARVHFSSLPNVYFVQQKVDPVVLIEKAPEVSSKTVVETPRPAEKPKKEKKGFLGRIKGFFGSLFHR